MNWISIENELPDFDQRVLWIREDGYCFIDEIDHDNTWNNFKSTWERLGEDFEMNSQITHWCVISEPTSSKSFSLKTKRFQMKWKFWRLECWTAEGDYWMRRDDLIELFGNVYWRVNKNESK